MPKYIVNGKTYNIPDDKVEGFERKYPDANVEYNNDGKTYHIPINKREGFLKQYPNAVAGSFDQPAQPMSSGSMQLAKTTPFDQSNSVAPTPSEKPEEEKVQLSFTAPKRPELKSLQVEQKEYPTIAETTQKMMADNISQRHQLSDMTSRVQSALDRRGGELDEAQKTNKQSYIPQGTAGSIPAFDAGRMYDPEYRNYAAAKESLQKAQDIIDAVGKESEDKEKGHTGFGGFLKGAARGAEDAFYDWNTWSMGLKDTSEGLALLKALNAAEDGTLTESQQALLDAKALEIATEQAYSSSLGRGYKAGKMSVESLPFMIEFAFNPIAGAGNTAANRLARYAINRFGKETVKKNAGKYIAGKAISQVATDALKAGAITATTGAGRTAADALQRMQGDIYYQPNEEGKVEFWKREGGEDATTAFAKAYAGTTIENFSEMLGNYFSPIGKVAGIGVSKGLSKVGLGSVNQMLQDVKANDLAQLVADFEKRAQWNGTIGEFGEEIAGGILNSIIVGDQTLDTDENTGLFNKDNLIDTYLGVALLGGGLSAAKTVDYPIYKYESRKNINNARLDFEDAFGKDDETAKISEALTSDDPRIAGETLRNIIGNEDYTPEQQMTAAIYAKTVQAYKGAKLFDEKMHNDPEMPIEKVEVADSYDNGRSLETPQEKNDAYNMYESQAQNMRRVFGLNEDEDVDAFIGDDPLGFAMQRRNENPDDGQAVLDYLNAKATRDGMLDAVNDKIDETIAQSNATIDRRKSQTDGLIHPAILKGANAENDRRVYIISGQVSTIEGSRDIDTEKSDKTIIVEDAETGKKEFTEPSALLSIDEALDPEQEKAAAAEVISNTISEQAEREIEGILPFNVGESYTILDTEGAQHTVTILADTQDGNVQVSLDNAQEVVVMPKEQIQQMSEAYNIGRTASVVEAKKAMEQSVAPAEQVAEQTAPAPRIPLNEQGEPMYEQAPVYDTWVELVELNEGNEDEAIDTANIMRDNAQAELDKAMKSPKVKGKTVPEIQAAKAEQKALIKQAQDKLNYWTDVANYRDAQIELMKRAGQRANIAKAQAASQEKGRYSEENAALGAPIDFRDYVMRAIATGGIRFIWKDSATGTRGLGSHTGLKSNEERNARIWLLNNENGLYPEEAAEQLLTSYAEELGYTPNIDTMDALSEILDVVGSYATPSSMFEAAQLRHADLEAETAAQDEADAQARVLTPIAESLGLTLDEYLAWEEMMYAETLPAFEADYEQIIAIFVEAAQQEEILNQNNDERSTENADVQSSVHSEGGLSDGSQAGNGVLQGTQVDNSIADSRGTEAGQGGDAQVVEPSIDDIPASEVSGGAKVDNGYNGRSLTTDEAKAVVNAMQQNAIVVELLDLTPENWIAQFGEDGIIDTPIGNVKMGENQYFKLAQKGREGKLGMIKPTLQSPDIIVEEKSSAKNGQTAERNSSYVFVKAFTNTDGSRNYLFTSVTIRKDGKEVVISNQEKETPRIERLLKEGKLAYISKATLPSESTNSTQGNQSTILGGAILSESKDNAIQDKKQGFEKKNSVLSNTTDTDKTLSSIENDIATPENAVSSKVHTRPAVGRNTNTNVSGVDSGQSMGVTAPAGNSPQTSESKDTTTEQQKQGVEQKNDDHRIVFGAFGKDYISEDGKNSFRITQIDGAKRVANVNVNTEAVGADNLEMTFEEIANLFRNGQWVEASTSQVQGADIVTINKDKHTKTGEDLYVAKIKDRVSRDEYNRIKGIAKEHNGYYSTTKRGFVFKTEADAEAFRLATQIPSEQIENAKQILDEQRGYLDKVQNEFKDGKFKTIAIGKDTFASVGAMDDFIKEYNKTILDAQKQLKDGALLGPQTRTLPIKVDGYTFNVTTTIEKEMSQSGGQLFSEVHRKMSYSCVDLGLENIPVRQSLLRNAIEDITENVITGKDFKENIEALEHSITSNQAELDQLVNREGKPFEFNEELEKAKAQYKEYSELMKKEMEEKEAKYAEMDASVEAAQSLAEAEEDGEYRYRVVSYEQQFADLQAEYDALDKNDAEALNEWRERKKIVILSFMQSATNELRLPVKDFRVISNEAEMRDFYEEFVNFTKEDVIYDEFVKAVMKSEAFYVAGMEVIGCHTDGFPNSELNAYYRLFHEQTHSVIGKLFAQDQLDAIWDEALKNDKPKNTEGILREYDPYERGEEYLAYTSQRYVHPKIRGVLEAYLNGEVSIDSLLGSAKKSLPLRNQALAEILKYYKDEYKGEQNTLENTEVYERRRGESRGDQRSISQKRGGGERSETQGTRNSGGRQGLRGRVLKAATTLAESLGVKLNIIENVNDITDPNARQQRAKRGAKAWYDVTTGQVYFVLPNATSVEDAVQTVLHEVVAHKGLRDVVGREHFEEFLGKVFRAADTDTRRKIVALAAQNGWDFNVATEEYLASLAEEGFDSRENRAFLQKVRDLFMDMLRAAKIVLGFNINDNDMRYMLWRTYQMQRRQGAMAVAEDVVVQHKLGVGNYRYRSIKPSTPSTGEARRLYDDAVRRYNKKNNVKKTENLWHHLREAYQDSMLSVQKLMEAVLAETGNTLRSSDDVYKAENQLSSKNKAEIEKWERDFMKPLQMEILNLVKKGASYDDVVEYLMAKHGLERNLEFSRREDEENGKEWDGSVKRDYSGLTELTGEAEHFTEAAQQIVDEFESKYNTDNLWPKINAATKESLRKSYDSGLMSKETYDKVSTMFKYYVPLRGWDSNVAADQYEYMGNKGMKILPVLKTAKGRTSRADDPIATLGSVGESSIIQGNRNLMKLKFLNFAQNNPTSLLTVSEQWYEQNADGTWKPSNPEIPENASADEVDALIKEHEAKMEALGDKATKKRQGLNINLHTTKWEQEEHAVNVKRNGKEYKIFVNGNPIAAQAINGFTNPNANKKDSWEWIEQRATAVKNFMARAFTSMNPAFIFTNLARDLVWAGTSVAIKENAAYARQYTKNISEAMIKAQLPRLVSKWKSGTLDMNVPIEKYFNEFVTNGGETGFTQLNTVDDYKRNMERFIKEAQGGVTTKAKKGWHWIWDNVEFLNRSAEDTTRFMVYLTSRQMGRPITESIANAKDITVNFNKKGRGTMGANVLGFAYIFFNATIQSLANFGKLIANHPKKTAAALTTFGASGMIAPMVALSLQAMLSGDDDEPTYWDLPEWVRRNNIVIYVGGSGYVTIPLPHELRPFYGMGELAFSTLMGKEEPEVALQKAVEGFASLMPFDYTGNAGNAIVNFTPTIAQPLAQLIVNKDYFGTPIYRKTAFNEMDPEWTKAYKSTNQYLVDATEFINELTGGDEVKSGIVDLNPAVIEHLFEGYLGGVAKTINRTAKTFSMLWDEDARAWRNVPVLSSFYNEADERTSGSQVNREYFAATDEADEVEHLYSGYKKRAKMGSMEYAEKLNELVNSDVFKRYQTVNSYQKAVSKLNAALKDADNTDREEIETLIMELKVDMLEELDAMDNK